MLPEECGQFDERWDAGSRRGSEERAAGLDGEPQSSLAKRVINAEEVIDLRECGYGSSFGARALCVGALHEAFVPSLIWCGIAEGAEQCSPGRSREFAGPETERGFEREAGWMGEPGAVVLERGGRGGLSSSRAG